MLIELTKVPTEVLPVAELKSQLHMGRGFSDDDAQDALLVSHLQASLAVIEARTNKILLARSFDWVFRAWRDATRQPLPLAPVSQIEAATSISRDAVEVDFAASEYVLEEDLHRPYLRAKTGCLPPVPAGGSFKIRMMAGFGPDWADIPADLALAVVRLAAHYYDNRFGVAAETQPFPATVANLISPYRTVRILGGASS